MGELSFKLQPALKQYLTVMLNPRMMQMLNILHMPYIDLVREIEKAAEENVMLEIEKKDELIEYLKSAGKDGSFKKEYLSEEGPDIDSLPEKNITLPEFLEKQLNLEYLEPNEKKIGEFIIKSLDKNGYIKDYTKIKTLIETKFKVSKFIVEKVLKIIQGFEPDGVAARNLKECLIIQVKSHNFENDELSGILEKAISKHLDDLAKKNYAKIASSLGIQEEGAKFVADFIKNNLNPNPGSAFSKKSAPVVPSFAIREKEGRFYGINLEESYGPSIKINPEYLRMLDDPATDKKTMDFLKTKLENAKIFIECLQKRKETAQKIIDLITKTQSDFFKAGPLLLNPLMQKDIAEKLHVHPSTISRAVSDKYVETPKGLFNLKLLCPRELRGFTSEKIKSLLSNIVDAEKKSSPLSDLAIKEKLINEHNIRIERRTVAAYRNELNISSSFDRLTRDEQ